MDASPCTDFYGEPPPPAFWNGAPPRSARERARYRRLALAAARRDFAAVAPPPPERIAAEPSAPAVLVAEREPAAEASSDGDDSPAPPPSRAGARPADLAHAVYLTPPEAARYLRLSPNTLAQWRSHGVGPPYVKLGAAVRYVRSDLDRWAAERRCGAA